MELSEELQEMCNNYALENMLSDTNEMSYKEIIDTLNNDDNWEEYVFVWEPFDGYSGQWIADHIESLSREFMRIAIAAKEGK